MSLVIDNQCFPCVDYIKELVIEKYVKIESYERFQKSSFRNRYIIAGSNGLNTLSIPVKGGRETKQLIKKVEIDYTTNWNTIHWKSIVSCYSKAPFFEYYKEALKSLLFEPKVYLFDFNYKVLSWILTMLKADVVLHFTTEFEKEVDDAADLRGKMLPNNFQNNPQIWKPRYSQVFEDRIGFQTNLSIIDLLFSQGPNSLNMIRQSISDVK